MSEKYMLTGNHGQVGLARRHVRCVHIEWDDKPPSDIAAERLMDIDKALRFGFEKLDRTVDVEEIARTRATLSRAQEDEDSPHGRLSGSQED